MLIKLKKRRQLMKINQSTIAQSIGITVKHISDIEVGRSGASFSIALKISSRINYNLDPTGIMENLYDGIGRLTIDKVKQIAKKFNIAFDTENLFGE